MDTRPERGEAVSWKVAPWQKPAPNMKIADKQSLEGLGSSVD